MRTLRGPRVQGAFLRKAGNGLLVSHGTPLTHSGCIRPRRGGLWSPECCTIPTMFTSFTVLVCGARLLGRSLQRWKPPKDATGQGAVHALEESPDNGQPWDQFYQNKKMFGVVTTFDENQYTTQLDKSSMTASQLDEVERLAREIESSSASNAIISAHLAEERGQEVPDVRHSPPHCYELLFARCRACIQAHPR